MEREIFILYSLLISTLLFYTHTLIYNPIAMGVNLFILGFFFMSDPHQPSNYPRTPLKNKYVGSANAALWLLSQIGALTLIEAFEAISASTTRNYTPIFSSTLLIIALILVYKVEEK